jgi:NitT/TauT family transport system substrate-binding protein
MKTQIEPQRTQRTQRKVFSVHLCVLCVLCGSIAFALSACDSNQSGASSGGGGSGEKLTLQLNWKPEPQFGGFYAAPFDKHGLNVEVREGGVGTPTVQMVATEQVPFGVVSADEVVLNRAQGGDVVTLFAVYQTNPQGLMTRASRGFTDIGDIFKNEGTVAMQQGLPYANFLKNKYGFDKVRIVPSPGGDLTVYLKDEKYTMQCFVTSEPLAAKKAGAAPQTFLIAGAGYNPYTTVLVTHGNYLRTHPDVVQKVTDAVREGWTSYLADPANTNQAMQKLNPSMDAQTFADSAAAQRPLIETEETAQNGIGSMTLERWQTLAKQLADLKVIPSAPDAAKMFIPMNRPTTQPK